MAGQSKDAGNTITKLCFKEKQAGFGYFSNEMKSEARQSHTLVCSQQWRLMTTIDILKLCAQLPGKACDFALT